MYVPKTTRLIQLDISGLQPKSKSVITTLLPSVIGGGLWLTLKLTRLSNGLELWSLLLLFWRSAFIEKNRASLNILHVSHRQLESNVDIWLDIPGFLMFWDTKEACVRYFTLLLSLNPSPSPKGHSKYCWPGVNSDYFCLVCSWTHQSLDVIVEIHQNRRIPWHARKAHRSPQQRCSITVSCRRSDSCISVSFLDPCLNS